jgi:hypothetical protein
MRSLNAKGKRHKGSRNNGPKSAHFPFALLPAQVDWTKFRVEA